MSDEYKIDKVRIQIGDNPTIEKKFLKPSYCVSIVDEFIRDEVGNIYSRSHNLYFPFRLMPYQQVKFYFFSANEDISESCRIKLIELPRIEFKEIGYQMYSVRHETMKGFRIGNVNLFADEHFCWRQLKEIKERTE